MASKTIKQAKKYTEAFGPGAMVFSSGACRGIRDELGRLPGVAVLDGSGLEGLAPWEHRESPHVAGPMTPMGALQEQPRQIRKKPSQISNAGKGQSKGHTKSQGKGQGKGSQKERGVAQSPPEMSSESSG